MESWIKIHPRGGVLLLYIQAGASKTALAGLHGGRIKVKIKAPPRDGEANEAVVEYFSEVLGVAKAKIFLVCGESSRQKDLLVELPFDELIILGKQLLK